jgi:hypothetical protein
MQYGDMTISLMMILGIRTLSITIKKCDTAKRHSMVRVAMPIASIKPIVPRLLYIECHNAERHDTILIIYCKVPV